MFNRISEITLFDDKKLDCKFYNGDIKRYDLALNLPGESAGDKEPKLSSNGDKVTLGDAHINSEEIWQQGILIEHEEPELRYQFARMLICARKIKGMTQGQLSKLTGITQADISKLERGEGNPSITTMERVLSALDGNLVMDLNEADNRKYSISDIDKLPESRKVELFNGELYDMAQPGFTHAMILSFLQNKISSFVGNNNGNCLVVQNVALMEERDFHNYFVPDLMVICDRTKITPEGVVGPADWIIEIVSPESSRHDYRQKLAKYLQMGVREYWIVDPIKGKVIVYAASEDYLPHIYIIGKDDLNVANKIPVGIYNGDLIIDTSEIKKIIDEYSDKEN